MSALLIYRSATPDKSLEHFINKFWSLKCPSEKDFDGVIIPDGNIDLLLIKDSQNRFRIQLTGLETKPKVNISFENVHLLGISFKPLAVEYIFHQPIADILNGVRILPSNFWNFNSDYLNNFNAFCDYSTEQIKSLLPIDLDSRKSKLFELLNYSKGSLTVSELASSTAWTARQINRYFMYHLGLGLKAYANILRFNASLQHIKGGSLSPQENYFDQSHFIKEVKKFSGVSPRDLKRNQNDRFLQLSVIPSR